jgi:hypothetical protein
MTTLLKPIRRRVDADQGRVPIIVTVYPGGVLGFRELRSRTEYTLSVMSAYRMAVQSSVKRVTDAGKPKRGLS